MRAAASTPPHFDDDLFDVDDDAAWDAAGCRHLRAEIDARHCEECGAALGGQATSGGISLARWWRRLPPQVRRRRVRVGLTIAAALLVLAGTWQVTQTWFGPSAPVHDVAKALESGDAAAVLAIVEPGNRELITDSPLLRPGAVDAGFEPPTDVDVTSVSYGRPKDVKATDKRDYAQVGLSYRLEGSQFNSTITVTKSRSWWSSWQVAATDVLAQVTVDAWHTASGGYRIATATSNTSTWPALPGSYAVVADGDGLYEARSTTVVAGVGKRASADFGDIVAKKQVRHAVDVQVRALVERCAAKRLRPECGFSSSTSGSRSSSWSVTQYPTVSLTVERYPDVAGNSPTRGLLVVSTRDPGQASAERGSATADINLHGYVVVGDDRRARFVATVCPPFARSCEGERQWNRGIR